MIRHGARFRYQHQVEQERRERERQVQITHIKRRWKPFSYPIQAELQVHLSLYGVLAADHATSLLERLHQEQQRPSPASSMLSVHSSPSALSREQLILRHNWGDFPPEIQKMLFLHYTIFSSGDDQELGERDVQEATNMLQLVLDNPDAELGLALSKHRLAFGVASMVDVATMAAKLSLFLKPQQNQ